MTTANLEKLKTGIALADVARNTVDKTLAKAITKQAFSMIGEAAKAFTDIPDNWCGTPPIPFPWPKRILDATPEQFNNQEVLGQIASIKKNIQTDSLKTISSNLMKEISLDI